MDYKLPQLPERPENSHKGTFGKILNVAGSEFMPGAAYLSSIAALKVGAGYIELCSHKNVLNAVSILAPEVVLASIEKISKIQADVLLIGCGLSTSGEAVETFITALAKNLTTIIDADGLNILAKISIESPKNLILTPHPKEASRLLGCSVEDIVNNMEVSAKAICEKYHCITVLKSHNTIVTNGVKTYINNTGNSALSKAGSGDVLAGMVAGFIAQKMSLFDAATLAVYLHGLAGELAAKDLTEYSVLATDTIKYIHFAIKNYAKKFKPSL